VSDGTTEKERKHSRGGILGILAAALTGAAVGSKDASAANGQALTLGQQNDASTSTVLTAAGLQIVNDAALVVDGSTNADYGILASGTYVGTYGKGTIGVFGEGTVGGVFSGTAAAISLTPLGASGPPASSSVMGDVVVDARGVMWLCTASSSPGDPGSWVPVSGGSTQFLSSPQRLFDSRDPNNTGPRFQAGTTHNVGVTSAGIGVPANARAIVANLTVTATSSYGFLTAFPTGVARPITSNVNWGEAQTVANSATIKLGAGGQISLYVEHSDAHVIVDVAGYII
jgi:hypothetical protein